MTSSFYWLRISGVMLILLFCDDGSANQLEGEDCGILQNAYGPFDYRNPDVEATRLRSVENAHFTIEVESLERGRSAALPGGDISYILRAFPNHHRALFAMSRYSISSKSRIPPDSDYSIDCWFDRAKRFRPDDGMVWLIAGIHYSKVGDVENSKENYLKAIEIMPRNAEGYYNLGLLYFDTGEYPAAREAAEKAYQLGHPLPGLRNKLNEAGAWGAGAQESQ